MSKKIEVDTKTFVRFWLVILAFVLSGILIWRARVAIVIIFLAMFFAVALQPLMKKIDSVDKRKKRRSLASVISVLMVVVGVGLVCGLVGPVVVNETAQFVEQAPAMIEETMEAPWINDFGRKIGIKDLSLTVSKSVGKISDQLVGSISGIMVDGVSAIGQVITGLILVIVLTILFMLEGPGLLDIFWQKVRTRNKEVSVMARRIVEKMGWVVATYVSRQMLVAILDGMATIILVLILSIMFGFSAGLAVPMGLISMVLYLIPLFGPVVSCILISAVLAFNVPLAGLSFLAFYIIYQQIENNWIAPRIQGKGLAMSPLIILIAIVIGMYAFGLIGTIVAIPVAGCIKVLLDEYPSLKKISESN